MNEGRVAKIAALEKAIAEEKAVEDVYTSRDVIYNILEVSVELASILHNMILGSYILIRYFIFLSSNCLSLYINIDFLHYKFTKFIFSVTILYKGWSPLDDFKMMIPKICDNTFLIAASKISLDKK